ncbi:MAG: hypothetical protein ACOYI3_04295 [Christensenellales bacterium]
MKGWFAIGVMAGSIAGAVAATMTLESMHPGMLAKDGRRMARKIRNMTNMK